MKKEISPGIMFGIIAAVVLLVGGAIWMSLGREPAKVDIKQFSAEELRDPDPPRGGRPGG